jgi:hypothetical protein
MDRLVPNSPDDVTVYLVVNDFGKIGKAYVETDIAEADREAIIRNFISGQYSNALPRRRIQHRRGLVAGRVGGHRERCAGTRLRCR